jgi:hypothetical protein
MAWLRVSRTPVHHPIAAKLDSEVWRPITFESSPLQRQRCTVARRWADPLKARRNGKINPVATLNYSRGAPRIAAGSQCNPRIAPP